MHACTHVRIYISRVSIALYIILCERRHVFPVCVKLCGVVSRKGGNIGEISAYTNSHRVDLHTYRWFDSPSLAPTTHTYTHLHIHLHIGTCAISWATSWTMRWTMHSFSSECPIWRFMRRSIRALNILLFASRVSIYCTYKFCNESISFFFFRLQ